MTLEQIKADIDRQIARCNTYGYGLTAKVLERIKRLLDNLEPSWHEYPKEQPKEDTWVLVTFEDGRIEVDHFYCGKFVWWPSECVTITAWMEMPKPYKKEVEK